MRCTYDGAGDLRRLMPDFTDEEAARTDFGSYPAAAFYDDMFRLTRYRTDGALCERLVAESFPTLLWLAEKGVRFVPIFGRQSFMVDGKMKFWGGEIGRAHVCTPVTNAHLVCRLLLENKKRQYNSDVKNI